MTSRSIMVRDFPWLRYAWCGDCVSLEEASQHAVKFPKKSKCRRAACSKTGPILTTKDRLCTWSTSFSVQPEIMKQYNDSQLCSLQVHKNDDVQDFDVRCDVALLPVSEVPSDTILEGLYKSKLQNSVQLQTVLALYDQETARSKEPNNQQSKTAVKLHFDLMMWTRNFRVRNDVAENGSVTKRQKRKKA